MENKDFSLDDILLEVGFSSTPEDGVDVDALLNNIVSEKKEENSDEPPTKEFKAQKQTVSTAKVKPVKKPMNQVEISNLEDSGPIFIDTDAIKEKQKPPVPIPVDKEAEDESEPLEIHFNREREEHDFDRRLDVSPAFLKLVSKIKSAPFSEWEEIIIAEKNSFTAKGFLLSVLSVVSLLISMMIYSNAASELGLTPSPALMIVAGMIGAVAGLIALPLITSGIKSIKIMEPNRDIIPTVAYIFCALQYISQLIFPKGLTNANIHQYLPVGILILSLSFFAKSNTAKTALTNIHTLKISEDNCEAQIIWDNRAATELSKGLTSETAYPVVNRRVEEVSDFTELSFSMDTGDRLSRDITLFGTAFALVVALFVFLFTMQKHFALTVMTAFVCVFSSVVNLYLVCYPLLRVSKRTSIFKALICGEKSGLEYGDVNVAVITAADLFPSDSVVLNGIKTFEGMRIDEAILDAASVLNGADSILTGTFLKIIGGRTELLSKSENLHYEDGKGLSAWIDNRRILIGNRELMASHNIRVPSLDYEKRFTSEGSDLVYLSASGELTAVFIFSLIPSIEADEAVQMLYRSDVALSVKTNDCIVTKERLGYLFGIESNFFKILPNKLSKLYAECSQTVKVRPAIAINDGSFTSMACSVASAKRIRVMLKIAFVVMICSVVLGGLLIAVFGCLGATKQLTPLIMYGYQLVWLIIHALLQKTVLI